MDFDSRNTSTATTTSAGLDQVDFDSRNTSTATTASAGLDQVDFDSRNTSTATTASAGLDQVDFGVCAPIPEEPSAKEESNPDLIKMLDLSSNKLTDFKAFDHSEYGDLVYKRLRDVTSLDLKQNHIGELLRGMMKVCMCMDAAILD